MKIYLIAQDEHDDWETYDSAVVCAQDEETARNMNPNPENAGAPMTKKDWDGDGGAVHNPWCSCPESVSVKYLGEAAEGLKAGVVCASFNAG